MRETRKVTSYKCDNCGHVKTDDGLLRMGGSAFHGWYHLTRTETTSQVPKPPGFGELDFCSEQCVINYLTRLLDERYKREQEKKPFRLKK
jgi:hypothetical protein